MGYCLLSRENNTRHLSTALEEKLSDNTLLLGTESIGMMGGAARRWGAFLGLFVGLGLFTLRETYLDAPYQAPILRPNRLEFTVTTRQREEALGNDIITTTSANGLTGRSNSAFKPPELEFTVSSEELQKLGTTNFLDNWITTSSDNAREHRLPWCNREQLRNGTWVVDRRDRPPYMNTVKHLQCYPKEKYLESPYETSKWLPAAKKTRQCDYEEWDEQDFCRLLPRATYAIMGDSLSWEHYSSLVQMLGGEPHQGFQHQSKELHTNIVQSVCGGQTTLLYRRDDRLQNLTVALEQHFPTILVLNRGAHYAPDRTFLREIRDNIRDVRAWLAKCDSKKIKCHFFWRTTVPGHPHCGKFMQPVNDIAAMEALVADLRNYNEYTIKFHWYDFKRQNELVVEELRSAKLNSLEIIDAYDVNILRPDEHRAHQNDCLHNCYPGKMDIYNNLVLHYLRMQRTDMDIQRLVHVAELERWAVNENTNYDVDATEEAKFFRTGHRDYQRLFRDRPPHDD